MNKGKWLFFLFLFSTIGLHAQNTMVKSTEEDLYRSGLELLDHEKYGAAREFFQRYIDNGANDLRSVDARYYIAFCALNLFNDDAETLFQNFITDFPYHSKAILANFDLGTFYFNNKKYEKAIEYFEKSDETKLAANQKIERTFKLAYSYFNQKDFEKAEPLFNGLKSGSNKYSYASSYYAGYLELKNGKYDEALVDLKKAEENEAYKSIVPAMIANVYYWKGSFDELIAYSEKVLSSSLQNIQGKDDIFLMTADAYFYKKNYKKAAENFQKLVTENKSKVNPEIQYRYAYSLYKSRDVEGAITQFKGLAGTKDSLQQASAYYLGHAYLQSGKKDFALAAFDIAAKTSFNTEIQEQALFNYGKINFELKRYNESITTFKNFSKAFPKTAYRNEVQELLSESFLRTSNYTEAISYIESLKSRSNKINRAYQSVTFYNGVQLFNNENFEEAIAMFEKSTGFPFDKDILIAATFWKGEAYSAQKKYADATHEYSTVFQKTQSDDPYYLKSRYGIGYSYYNLKEYDKALPHFKKYTEELKNAKDRQYYDDAQLRLADLYFQRKDYDKAVDYYNDAINSKIKDFDHAYYYRGVVLGTLKKMNEAEKSLNVVINNYPQSIYFDDAIFEKAKLNFQGGNFEAALQGFSKIINEIPNSTYQAEALLRRAGVYTNLQKNDEAIADYESILTNFASSPFAEDAFIGLQDLYNQTGRIEDFKKWQDQMEKISPDNEVLVTSRFNTGSNLYLSQKYAQAIESLKGFLNNYPQNQKAIEARYYLADSYYRTGDTINAITNFIQVIESRDAVYSLRAVQKMADIETKRGNYDSAKRYHHIVAANARNKKEKTTAYVGLMQLYYATASYDSCIYYGKEIKSLGNASLDAESKALLYIGKSYFAKNDYTNATDYFVSTTNLAKDRNGAEAQYMIATIQYNQKKHRQSLETLDQFIANYSEYEDFTGQAFLLISDNLVALNEIFQAKATLNSIIENSKDEKILETAKNKLAELERKENGTHE